MEVIEKKPKVSVCVITYNQEKYIRQCLQSIVDQKTDFDFEVIVGDDCSTDGTRAIVQEFVDKYPQLVNPILHNKNIGGCENYRSVHCAASGQYIAHVDGDDWIYPEKLFKQVQYLDTNENCSLVAHRMSIWVDGYQVGSTKKNLPSISLTELLLGHPMFLSSSTMYRRKENLDIFPKNADFIDFYVYIQAALKADIGFVNEVLGGYTSNVGISSKRELMPYIQASIDLAKGFVPSRIINLARSRQYLSYAVAALMVRDGRMFSENILLARSYNKQNLAVLFISTFRKQQFFVRFFIAVYKKVSLINFKLKKLLMASRDD